MTPTAASPLAPAVDQPAHPLPALATFELDGYRRQLEHAIGFYDRTDPAAAALAGLREHLAEAIAEQEDQARIAARNA
jgi:hypothetical protein